MNKKTQKSNRVCCVVNCKNTYQNTSGVIFYNFPSRSCDQDVKYKWIKAVNRLDKNGKLWFPKKYSVICSTHFIGNERSRHPESPSYIPTIFPEVKRKRNINVNQQFTGFERALKRQKTNLFSSNNDDDNLNTPFLEANERNNKKLTCDSSTQVTFENIPNNPFSFSCSFEVNAVGTQITSPGSHSSSNNYCSDCDKFHGLNSIKKEIKKEIKEEIEIIEEIKLEIKEEIKNETSFNNLTETYFF